MKGTTEVTRAIRSLPWEKAKSSKHKGVTSIKHYVTMLSTAIIGVLDERAPLYKYIHSKNKFGDPWTDKHGMFDIFYH